MQKRNLFMSALCGMALSASAQTDLVAHYAMDGNGTESIAQLDAAVSGAIGTTDRNSIANSALLFDGVDDYLNAGAILNNVFTAEDGKFSFSFWINPSDVAGSKVLFGKYDVNGGKRQFAASLIDGKIKFGFFPTLNWNPYGNGQTVDALISADTWTHVAVTYDGSIVTVNGLNRIEIFINGESAELEFIKASVATDTDFDNALDSAKIDLGIGSVMKSDGTPDGTYKHFAGAMDEFKIYSGKLTLSEVKHDYMGDVLLADYPFNGNTIDETGQENTCTNNGAELTTDRFGKENSAYYFDGVDDFMEITPASPEFAELADYSISLWFKFDAWENKNVQNGSVAERYYLFNGGAKDAVTSDPIIQGTSFILDRLTDDSEVLKAATKMPDFENYSKQISWQTDASWKHIVFVRQDSITFFYIDGVKQNAELYANNSSDALMNMMHSLYLGTFSGNNPNYYWHDYNFKGNIDDVQIYGNALSETKIKEIYNYQPEDNNILLADYPFNGNTIDETGHENICTNKGAELTTDRFGKENSAYYFDGVKDFMQIDPVSAEFEAMNDYSISLWFKFDAWENKDNFNSVNSERFYIFNGSGGTPTETSGFTSPGSSFALDRLDNGDEQTLLFTKYDATALTSGYSAYAPQQKWAHAAIVRIGDSTALFINGEFQAVTFTKTANNDGAIAMMHELYLGTFSGNNPNYSSHCYNFKGSIDDVQIYGNALSKETIKELASDTSLIATVELEVVALTENASAYNEFDGSITLKSVTGATAPYTYLWSNGEQTESITGLEQGNYTLTVTDANGVEFIETYTVGYAYTTLAGSGDVSHESDYGMGDGAIDITVVNGALPYTYAWSNGADAEDLTDLSEGEYTVTVTDAIGEQFTRTFTVAGKDPKISNDIAGIFGVKDSAIAGAQLFAYAVTMTGDLRLVDSVMSATDGTFKFANLPVDEYVLYCPYEAVNSGYANTYYYMETESADATQLDINAGDITGIEFHLVEMQITKSKEAVALVLEVYPNPATSVLNLGVNAEKVEVINAFGSIVLSASGSSIDVSSLKAGTFTAAVTVNGVVLQALVVVQ